MLRKIESFILNHFIKIIEIIILEGGEVIRVGKFSLEPYPESKLISSNA